MITIGAKGKVVPELPDHDSLSLAARKLGLGGRQREVTVQRILAGTSKRAGLPLGIRRGTVETYLRRAKTKLGADSIEELLFIVVAEAGRMRE